MYPHHIRLRGPWQCEPVPSSTTAMVPAPRTARMPCSWSRLGLADFAGLVRFRRRFGYPGRLDADERVWLTCADVCNPADLWVNGTSLARHRNGSFEFDVTAFLSRRNELVIEMPVNQATQALWEAVVLEVRCTAFLRGVRVRSRSEGLEVSGEVVGEADRPLELYVLLDGKQAGYETIAPLPGGQAFSLFVTPTGTPRQPVSVQVDLVNGATVWYTMTREFGEAAGDAAGE